MPDEKLTAVQDALLRSSDRSALLVALEQLRREKRRGNDLLTGLGQKLETLIGLQTATNTKLDTLIAGQKTTGNNK